MSIIKANSHQIGQSLTATNNFSWYQPSSPDGTVRLGVGNAGATSSDVLVANSSGNVGIGTSSPSYKLDVSGAVRANVASYNQFIATRSSQSWVMGIDASNNWVVRDETGGDTKMYLSTSGNLGLGVTPSAWGSGYKTLQNVGGFVGSAVTTAFQVGNNCFWTGSAWGYVNTGSASLYNQSLGVHAWYNVVSGTAGNTFSFTQAMTLDASGRLVVGAISSPNGAIISAVAGSNQHAVTFSSATSSYATIETINTSGVTGAAFQVFRFVAGSANLGVISANGTTNVTYGTSSDARLKENIIDAPSALNSVNAIKVRSFDWRSDNSHVDFGYIAQELAEVVPEAVSAPADSEDMLCVDFGRITPRLVKAIQELSAQVTTLQAEINALKA